MVEEGTYNPLGIPEFSVNKHPYSVLEKNLDWAIDSKARICESNRISVRYEDDNMIQYLIAHKLGHCVMCERYQRIGNKDICEVKKG